MGPLSPADAVPSTSTGIPFSPRFGDAYHAYGGALAQARHVFLGGNGLPARWRGRTAFTVAETGFGLGLNFLALWQAWRDDPARCTRLHMLSVEAHPFTRADLAAWLARVAPPALHACVDALVAAWPPPTPGLHRLVFEGGAVTLTLALGDAQTMVPQWRAAVDAFFLDGFSPERNPQMWQPALMQALAAHAAPGATAATWTCAGDVRRALRAAGFAVRKAPGFKGKREMTVAEHAAGGASGLAVLAQARRPSTALVIGAGVAGAGAAQALAAAGWTVQVLADAGVALGVASPWRDAATRPPIEQAPAGPAVGAVAGLAPGPGGTPASGPGHLAAALTPQVDRDDSVRARLARAGALAAARTWAERIDTAGLPQDGAVARRCGTVQLMPRRAARDPDSQAAWWAGMAALGMPAEWMRLVRAPQASALAGQRVGRDGLYFPGGLQVFPAALCAWLLAHPGITVGQAAVARLRAAGGAWQALDAQGRVLAEADVVVVACAGAAPALLAASGLAWPLGAAMQHVGGQVTLLPASGPGHRAPDCIVAGDGYALPAVAGLAVTGSTYDHVTPPGTPVPVTAAGHETNLAYWRTLLPDSQLPAVPPGTLGWAGWRAVLPGRLPAVGALPGAAGIYLTTGHASRGMSWSALGAQVLVDAIAGAPAPLERALLGAVDPARGDGRMVEIP